MASNSDAANSAENNGVDLNTTPGDKAKKRGDKKRKKKKSKRKGAVDVDESFVTNIAEEEEEESAKTEAANEEPLPIEETPEQPDNLVLRKLLRGPRYFDPPDTSWGSCYNCGEQGHKAADCTTVRKKKACYYCGSTDHSFKKCTKGRDCFICKTGGHKAKDCPERNKGYNNGDYCDKICLKCGDLGHDMFSCKNNYFPEDLKAIQCYVCNGFGHLCCYKSTDHVSSEVSCFKCGSLGHTGLACARLLGESAGTSSPNLCYNCGERGHFARECPHSLKACKTSRREMVDRAPSSCHSCGEEGHFLRDCPSSLKARLRLRGDAHGGNSCYNCGDQGHFARECPEMADRKSDSEMTTRNKKIKYDDHGMATYSEPKLKVGWTAEHPAHSPLSSRKPMSSRKREHRTTEGPTEPPSAYGYSKNSWASPTTPASRKHQIRPWNNGGRTSGSRSYNNNYSDQSRGSDFNGSTDQSYHHRFPASRFYNYSYNSAGSKSSDRFY